MKRLPTPRAHVVLALTGIACFTTGGLLAGCLDPAENAAQIAFDGGRGEGGPGTETNGAQSDASTDGSDGPRAELSTRRLEFGLVDCGGPAQEQTLVVQNRGNAHLQVRARIEGGAAFHIAGEESVGIAAGGTATLRIASDAVPVAAPAGTSFEATLVLETNDPASAKVDVPIHRESAGATLTLAPASAAFGNVLLDEQAEDVKLALTNTGNKAVEVEFGAASDLQFGVTWEGAPARSTLAPGASLAGLVARFRPTSIAESVASAPILVTGATCGASATDLAFSGQGIKGAVSIRPGVLDFGRTACGTTAAPRTIAVRNPGTAPFRFDASLGRGAASPYAVAPATGSVAPGAEVALTVTPLAVPATSSTAADAFGDRLSIRTDIAGEPVGAVEIRQTARGARLAVDRASVVFGDQPVGATTTVPVSVTNSGNEPARVSVVASGAPFGASPAQVVTLAAGATLSAESSFTPTETGAASGTLRFATAPGDALCAPVPPAIPLSGAGTNGAIALSASALDFGRVACGTRGAARTLTLRNTGSAPFTWSADLGRAGASPFALTPASGSIDPAGNAVITLTPRAIPAAASVADNAFGDVLTVRTTGIVGDAPHAIPLTQTAEGAIFAFDRAAVAFGDVAAGSSATAPFTITNSGNAPAAVSFAVTNPLFAVTPVGPTSVAPQALLSMTARFAPTAAGAQSGGASVSVRPTDALCAPLPAGLTLGGRGTSANVGVSPTAVDFGQVDCGATGAARTVTLSNVGGTRPYVFTAALVAGTASPFTVSPARGTVPAGGQVNVTVTPRAVPATSATTPNLYSDTLRVTTDALNDTPHDVPLTETARGAILSVAPPSLDYGALVAVGTTRQLPVTLRNSGNAAATVTFGGLASTAFSAPAAQSVEAGGSRAVPVDFRPTTVTRVTASAPLQVTGAALCAPLPAALTLAGTGARVTVLDALRTLPNALCGQPVAGSTTVRVQNESAAAVTVTPSLTSPTLYTVTPATATAIAAGATATFTVRQRPVPLPTAPRLDASTLRFTTNLTGDTVKTSALRTTVEGAVLQFQPATINWGSVRVQTGNHVSNFAVVNTGTGSVTLQQNSFVLSTPPTGVRDFEMTVWFGEFWQATLAAAGRVQMEANFAPFLVRSYARTVSFAPANIQGPVCSSTATLSLTGTGIP